MGVPVGTKGSPLVEHNHVKSSAAEISSDKIRAKGSEGSKPLISFKELRSVFLNIKRKLKCPDGQTLGRVGAGLANGEPQEKKNKNSSCPEEKSPGPRCQQGRLSEGNKKEDRRRAGRNATEENLSEEAGPPEVFPAA